MPIPPSTRPPTAIDEECALCNKPLLVPSSNDQTASFIIDDVELLCQHHFHMNCIIEDAKSRGDIRDQCALCSEHVLDQDGAFMVTVRNEGGCAGEIDLRNQIEDELFYEVSKDLIFLDRNFFTLCIPFRLLFDLMDRGSLAMRHASRG
jgi:hypothetical protein